MTANIDKIRLWDDNPDKSRTSRIVRIDFKFPCTWTTLEIEELKEILRLWIITEEQRYPKEQGFQGRNMLLNEILEVFEVSSRLDEMLKEANEDKGEVQAFFDEEETRKIVRIGRDKIKRCAWVIENKINDPTAVDNAKKSARIWERILDKIESQLT